MFSPQPGYKLGQEHLDIVVWSLTHRFVSELACTLPWELAYMMADDVQVENLEETDEVYVENLETDGVYVENLEGHTKTEKEDELAMRDQSKQKLSRVPHELSS